MPPVNPEFWRKEVTINLNVITLMAVHGNLLLALRHPQNIGESRDLVIDFVKQIGEELVLLGAMAPEQLKEAYRVESENGIPELLDGMADIPGGAPGDIRCGINLKAEKFITDNMNSEEPFEMLLRDAKCCACGNPMSSSLHLNFVSLDKKATWKKPVWDNLLLKPVYPRIPRAIAVLCNECIENNRQAIEVIEVEGEEIRYHKVWDLEDAFQITPDMIMTDGDETWH
jgi:hypothetical protein